MNLQGKINTIKDAKDRIKAAIIAKGVTPSGNISTYANAISEIDTTNNQNKIATENGVVTPDSGYTGLGQVTVNVNQSVQNKTITANGSYHADSGYVGLGEVEVAVPFETETITVNPSVEAQQIETTVDGIEMVIVNPVTANIDNDITANNIRQGVEILGVTGNIVELQGQTKDVSVTNSGTTTIIPDANYNGFTSVSITPNLQSKTATANGTVVADNGYCGLSEVDVDVNLNLQDKRITQNGTYTPDSGYNGFENVTVDVNLNLQNKTITSNGSYTADVGYTGFDNVTVNVQPSLQSKTITVNGTYTPDAGYDGLSSVTVATESVNNTNLTVTSNGTYTPSGNYTGYGSVTVNVPQSTITGSGITRVVENGVYGYPSTGFQFKLPNEAKDLKSYALFYAFQHCSSLTSVDLSSLTTVSGTQAMQYAFQYCTSLTSVDLSGLTTLSGTQAMQSAFAYCSSLTSVDLSSLTTLSGNGVMLSTFAECTSLTSVDLSSLTTVNRNGAMQYAFQNCTSLTSLSFPSLTSTSFGSYTNQFNYMLARVTGCTVHFPSNLQSVIGSWSDVQKGFGGTNTTVLFDLPATT